MTTLKPGDLCQFRSWSVRLIGYAADGRAVFERVGVYADGKRYACPPEELTRIEYVEDDDE